MNEHAKTLVEESLILVDLARKEMNLQNEIEQHQARFREAEGKLADMVGPNVRLKLFQVDRSDGDRIGVLIEHEKGVRSIKMELSE